MDREYELLEYRFSDVELLALGQQLARSNQQVYDLRAEKVSAVASLVASIKLAEKLSADLTGKIERKSEMRETEVISVDEPAQRRDEDHRKERHRRGGARGGDDRRGEGRGEAGRARVRGKGRMTFEQRMAKARATNARRDATERRVGFANPQHCDLGTWAATVESAIEAGIQTANWDCVAEGLAMLHDMVARLRAVAPPGTFVVGHNRGLWPHK